MTVAISLLRGVNVTGRNMVKMETFRGLCQAMGHRDVQTYVQSGNVVFRTRRSDAAKIEKQIEDAIEEHFGFRPDVMVRTSAQLRDVIARNPFAKRNLDPGRVLVYFLKNMPSAEAYEKTCAMKTDPEELRLSGRELFLYYPNGVGKSKLPMARVEKALATSGTGRNWNTVTKLMAMADALEVA